MPPSSPSNPYIAGPPINSDTDFFGREDIIQEVERTLRYPNHNSVILYGQRRIGKTSLLRQLERRLPTPPFFSVYFDLAGKEFLPVDQLLYQIAVTAAEKANMSMASADEFQDNPDAFHQTFLPALYQKLGSEHQPVFLLDEFNLISTPEHDLPEAASIRNLDDYVYNLISTQTYTDFVFAAGRRMAELSAVEQSDFKPNLIRFVSVLNPEQARALILRQGTEQMPHYDDATIAKILKQTRGHPYLTQLMCKAIFERAVARSRQKPEVTVEDVEAVLPTLLQSANNDLSRLWESIPVAERITLAAAAGRLGENDTINQAVLDSALNQAGISLETRGLSRAPQNLVNWQLLEQSGGDYRFFIEFMRRWIAQEHPLDQVKKEQSNRFNTAVEAKRRLEQIIERAPESPVLVKTRGESSKQEQPISGRRWLWPIIGAAILLLLLLLVCTLGGYLPFGFNQDGTATTAGQQAISTPISSLVGGGAATATVAQAETGQENSKVIEAALTPTPTTVVNASPDQQPTVELAVATGAGSEQPDPAEVQPSGQIRVIGSTTMQSLFEDLAIAFTAERPNVQIVIQGGGSQLGLEAVRQGLADAGMVSRALDSSELNGLELFTLVQNDVIAVIVHPLLLLDNLTTAQIRAIFTGEITNWAEVGGPDAAVQVVNRGQGSGTRAVFEQTIMGSPDLITTAAVEETTNRAVRDTIASQPYTIGYVALNIAEISPEIPQNLPNWAVVDNILLDVKLLSIDGVAPTAENALAGSYPLARPLNIVTQSPPGELIQEGLNFIFSPAGQHIIEEAGYTPAALQ